MATLKDHPPNWGRLWNEKENSKKRKRKRKRKRQPQQLADWITHCLISMWFLVMWRVCAASVCSRCLLTDSTTEPVTTTSPDSINKCSDFKSCWVKRNFINIMKLCLWQILTHCLLVVNSALNIIHEAKFHPQQHQTPLTNQLILGVVA